MNTGIFYQHEVALWRGHGAMFWSAVLLPLSCQVLVAVYGISLWHPYLWVSDFFCGLLSMSKWTYLISMCFAYCITMASRRRFYSVIPEVRTSQWSTILNLFQPGRMFHIILNAIAAGFLCWSLLHVLEGDYQGFSKPCSDNQELVCLNEHHVFVVLHAVFLGMVSSMAFFSGNSNLIHYPVIQQNKWNQGRAAIVPTLRKSAWFVLNKLKYFYLLYYLILGHVFKQWILGYSPILTESHRVNSIFGLLDIKLFLVTWSTSTLLQFLSTMFTLLYTAYQTEPYEFIIQSDMELDNKRKLVDALACDRYPLLQFQGYQDLYLLAKNSARRRAEIFSLSALGGHPHNWMSISAECLSSLQKFSEHVRAYNTRTMANGSVIHATTEKPVSQADVNTLSYRSSDTSTITKQDTQQPPMKEHLTEKLYKELSKIKLLGPLLAPLPEASSRQLLSHTQKYIWNIEALSHLVTASYSEDTYGVVQKSLPDIITTLVTVQEEIEKLMKLTSSGARAGQEGNIESALHTRLRATLKSAMYNIVTVFGQCLESIPVQQEVKKRLRQFSEYKL